MRSTVTSLFAVAFVVVACDEKETSFTTACVLSDESGAVFQCFEQSNDEPRNLRKAHCDDFEAAKKELTDGHCPSTALGMCHTGADSKSPCYRDRARCEASCKEHGGTFSP
jgi:hypothetical protein